MNSVELQNLITEYNTYYTQGQIDKNELIALLQGINIMEDIDKTIGDMYEKEQMNTILNAAISLATALA
jgi:hypothetical protein